MQVFNAFKAGLFRELKRMVSRPIYLVIMIVIPLISFLFFAGFMSDGLPKDLPIGIIDHDNSVLSRKIIRQIEVSQENKIYKHYSNFSEARADMQRGKIFAFAEIPANLEKKVLTNRQPTIHFYYHQTYLISGSLVLKDLSSVLATTSAGLNLKTRQAMGQNMQESMSQVLPIAPEIHAIGNPETNYSIYLINVTIPGMLQLMVLLATVFVVGTELKESTSLIWLQQSGNSIFTALTSKLLPYTFGFTVMGIFSDILLFKILNYPLHTNILWMFLATFLKVLSAQAIGIFMIGVFPVLRDGLSFAGLFGMLSFSYSGLSFPIEGMPALLQSLSFLFPLRHFFRIYQILALNGFPLRIAFPYFLYLSAFLILPFIVLKRLNKALIFQNYPKK